MHRLARHTISALLLPALVLAGGCKVSIPDAFGDYVPAEHRDKVELATETDGSGYGADTMLIITYAKGVSDEELDAAYAKTIEGAGFTELASCKADGQPVSRDFIKAPAEHVQVFFRLAGSDEAGPMLHVFHSDKMLSLGGGEGCTFTDAAKVLCATLEPDRCVLPE